MKLWLKLLIGSILGICIGFIIPSDNQALLDNMAWLSELFIRIGRYVLVPMLVFSLTIAVYELRQDKKFWGLVLKTFPVMIICSAFVITAGIAAVRIFPPGRIPIDFEQAEAISLNTANNVMAIFPSNMFAAITGDGVYLLPACIFAFFLGIGLSYDRNYTKPVISLLDSLSRIFYYIIRVFSEVLGLLMIALSAYWAVRFNGIMRSDIFMNLVLLLGILSVVLGCVILPLVLYLIKPKTNPWRVLYGSINQALAGFFSGDMNFTLPLIFRSIKENLGTRRRANTVTVTIFAFFGRAGSAMVAAVSLIAIINTNFRVDITPAGIIGIGFSALVLSFLLSSHPGTGAYTALAVLCLGYGQGIEAGYLTLKPMAFYLIAIGTFLDVMITSVASHAICCASGFQDEEKEIKNFI